MWLDGLFGRAVLRAEYAQDFNKTSAKADFDDVVKQFKLVNAHLYDAKTGLYFHGWDEKREQEWRTAAPARRQISGGAGWVGMRWRA